MSKQTLGGCNTSNKAVLAWVQEMANLCRPDQIYWCNGSPAEKKELTEVAVNGGVLIKLNQKKLPGHPRIGTWLGERDEGGRLGAAGTVDGGRIGGTRSTGTPRRGPAA